MVFVAYLIAASVCGVDSYDLRHIKRKVLDNVLIYMQRIQMAYCICISVCVCVCMEQTERDENRESLVVL